MGLGVWDERWEATCGLTMGQVCAIPSCLAAVESPQQQTPMI